MIDTRWYLRRDADLVQFVVEERAEPRRGVVTWIMPEELEAGARPRFIRRVIPMLRAELERRIARAMADPRTFDAVDDQP